MQAWGDQVAAFPGLHVHLPAQLKAFTLEGDGSNNLIPKRLNNEADLGSTKKVEIVNTKAKQSFFSCTYRNHSSSPIRFKEHLE